MDLIQAQDWSTFSLAYVVVEPGITCHVFRL